MKPMTEAEFKEFKRLAYEDARKRGLSEQQAHFSASIWWHEFARAARNKTNQGQS